MQTGCTYTHIASTYWELGIVDYMSLSSHLLSPTGGICIGRVTDACLTAQ